MTVSVNYRELRGNLSSLLKQAESGTEIAVTVRGREVARLVPPRRREPRRLGALKGEIWMAPDFDETPAEIIDAMEGHGEPE